MQSNMNDFSIIKKLGEGAFGQVFLVRRKTDLKEYALKKIIVHKLSDK